MGLTDCPITSVSNHHHSLRNNPEERSSHLHDDGSLKSRKRLFAYPWLLPDRTELMECEAVSGKYSDFMFRSMAGGCAVSLEIISYSAPFSKKDNLA